MERTTELRIQFPVSSGQHHRKGEEWRPVSPSPAPAKEEKTIAPVTPIIVPTSCIPLPPDPTPKPTISYNQMESVVQQQQSDFEAPNAIATAFTISANVSIFYIFT